MSGSDEERSEVLSTRVAELEAEIERLRSAHQALAHDQAQLRLVVDAHHAKETPFAYVLRRLRNIPASIRRRRRERRLRRTIAAETPEVSAAELARQRAVVDSFLDETGSAVAITEKTPIDTQFSLASSDDPIVSIVLPVYGATDEVLTCLRSFVDHPPATPYEIIIANDATPEEEFAPIREVGGLRILDQPQNLGFLANCNAAAKEARGRYVWFLNSDTEIRPRSLDALVESFDLFPNAAIVGSKLLFADGVLQDAGGIVWSDGSAWNYGRGSDPTLPTVNYAREADYVSGASLIIRRDVLDELGGGFDTLFVPAYYEDTDICMQAREAGYSVIYQPASEIVHHEGASHGTDVDDTSSMKHHQKINQETFLRKWKHVLANHRPNGVEPEREKERAIDTRVLIIDARTISPDQDSGSLRMFNVLRALRSVGAKATFLPINLTADEPYASELRQRGVEMVALPHVANIEEFLRSRGAEFDMVMLSRLEVAEELINTVRRLCPNATIVYDTVDLHFLRQQRELNLTGTVVGGADPEQTRRQELSCVVRSDVTLVCSTVEQTLLGRLLPESPVEVLGNVHELVPTRTPPSKRSGLLFVGGFEHPPNIDAMEWFTAEVLPMIREDAPDITLNIVGSKMPDQIKDLAAPGVVVHGYVPDLAPLYESTRISIAPLRYGAGVKGKVTEALARGLPCVGTSMAVEGAGLIDGTHLLIADDPEAYAAACLRLLDDDVLWTELAEAGMKHLESTFGLSHTANVLSRTLRARAAAARDR